MKHTAPEITSATSLNRVERAADRDGAWRMLAARLLAASALVVSAMVVAAWLVGLEWAIRVMPGMPAMKFNTALAMSMLALAVYRQAGGFAKWVPARSGRAMVTVTAVSAGVLAMLTIAEMLSGVSLWIDELFVTDRSSHESGAAAPGRMSPATACAVLLIACGVLALARTTTRPCARWVVRACTGIAAGIGFFAGVALVLSTGGLTQVPFFSSMALHTAWLTVLLSGGIALAESGVRRGAVEAVKLDLVQLRTERLLAAAVLATLSLGVMVTLVIGRGIQQHDHEAARMRFERLTDRIASEARRRVELPVYGLKGARGMYAASKSVERGEFRSYVATRNLGTEFPGALGIGFIQRVKRAGVDAFLAAERADEAPEFAVTSAKGPGGSEVVNADDLYVIKYIEPLSPNRAAWGFDVGSEPVRRAAAEEAARSGQPTLTGRISLVQDDQHRAGFLFFVPVYRNGASVATEAERVEALYGLVYAPLVIDEVFAGLETTTEGNVDFEVFEGESTSMESLLFDMDGHLSKQSEGVATGQYAGRMFASAFPLLIGGRTWTVRVSTTPHFHASAITKQPLTATMAGLMLSTLAAWLVWTMGRSRVRAHQLAVVMTADLRRATVELERIALTDKLTGLPNRALLLDRLGQAMARFGRTPEHGYAVLFLDFDRFKLINDTMGHEAGDQLLIQIAQRLRAELRTTDSIARVVEGSTAARLGGDEFVVLLGDLMAQDDAKTIAGRLIETFAKPYEICGQMVVSTASIGVVGGDERYTNAADVLRDADVAMYEAKAAGKGRYIVFDATMRDRILRRADLERDLVGAPERGELSLHYQPIVHVETGRTTHVEALLRWNHPMLGSVGPAEFVPIAEESGQIVALGEWVFREAGVQARRWRDAMGSKRSPRINVNIARKQLASPDLAARMVAIAEEVGIAPTAFCLEIAEAVVMRDAKGGTAQMERLREAGFQIALDDFGTGQSSLASLHTLPINVVKLNRGFLAHAGAGRANVAMMQAVTSLATNLGLVVVAKGVETEEQLALLQTLECVYAQGYYFGRPGPVGLSEVEIWVGTSRTMARKQPQRAA